MAALFEFDLRKLHSHRSGDLKKNKWHAGTRTWSSRRPHSDLTFLLSTIRGPHEPSFPLLAPNRACLTRVPIHLCIQALPGSSSNLTKSPSPPPSSHAHSDPIPPDGTDPRHSWLPPRYQPVQLRRTVKYGQHGTVRRDQRPFTARCDPRTDEQDRGLARHSRRPSQAVSAGHWAVLDCRDVFGGCIADYNAVDGSVGVFA